jgi:iron complex outermembrane receptor protein
VSHAYKTTDIGFSPAIVGAATLNFLPVRHLTISLPAKYVSKEYLDNAQQENRKLPGYYVQNFRAVYTLPNKIGKETNFIFQLNNVFDKRYTPNGYTYSYVYGGQLVTENFVFPMAGTNFMVAVNIKL